MRRHAACIVTALVLLGACAGAVPNALHVDLAPLGQPVTRLEINDRFLERNLGFGDVSVRRSEADGALEVQVIIANKWSRDTAFEYRFIWYDSRGFEATHAAPWLPAVLGPKESRGFRSTAPAVDASSFRLMVRMPHGVTPTGS
jgi:uncharacterized protein YcfL